MPTPVLAAKLFTPPPRPNAVLRADLIARLNAGLHGRLTLISAPAGFGKTSLASAWIAGCGRHAAWLSLDDADNAPARFLLYLVAALQTIAPTIGAGAAGALQSSQGDLDGALDLLAEAERRYAGDFSPNVRPVAVLRIRLLLAQGRLGEALDWAREQGLSAQDELSYLREFAHITLARVLLARSTGEPADRSVHEAAGLLERLLEAAEAGERRRSVIQILVLLSLARQMQGSTAAALRSLSRALTLAQPEGYVRVFVDEGPAMAALLEAHSAERTAQRDPLKRYRELLLSAFQRSAGTPTDHEPAVSHAAPERTLQSQERLRRANASPELLTERERDVLRLLRTYLSGPEIARELMMSLNTLRTHTRNIYDKLGVNSRQAAVRRAEELAVF
jgi:LuxR family maltose regulon positive regulatory protein